MRNIDNLLWYMRKLPGLLSVSEEPITSSAVSRSHEAVATTACSSQPPCRRRDDPVVEDSYCGNDDVLESHSSIGMPRKDYNIDSFMQKHNINVSG